MSGSSIIRTYLSLVKFGEGIWLRRPRWRGQWSIFHPSMVVYEHWPRSGRSTFGGDSGFAVLDFGLFSTFRDNVSRGHYGGIGQVLSMDWIFGDPTTLVTFLQNHDIGPDNDFKYRYKGEMWMAAATYNLLWTVRGIPCLYYGKRSSL